MLPKTAMIGTRITADPMPLTISVNETVVLPSCVENGGNLTGGRPPMTSPANIYN